MRCAGRRRRGTGRHRTTGRAASADVGAAGDELGGDDRIDHVVDQIGRCVPGAELLASAGHSRRLRLAPRPVGAFGPWGAEHRTIYSRRRDPDRERRLPLRGQRHESLPRLRPRRLVRAAGSDAVDPGPAGTRTSPRHQRSHRPRRGRHGVPAAQPSAQPVRQRHPGPAPGVGHLPRHDRTEGALRHRHRRERRRRQEHLRPHPAGPARAVARPSQGRPDHHRRLPLPEPGARRARHHEPQGLPRVVRHQGAAAGAPRRSRAATTWSRPRCTATSCTTSCPTRRWS